MFMAFHGHKNHQIAVFLAVAPDGSPSSRSLLKSSKPKPGDWARPWVNLWPPEIIIWLPSGYD